MVLINVRNSKMQLSRKILAIITFFMHVAKKKKINKTDTATGLDIRLKIQTIALILVKASKYISTITRTHYDDLILILTISGFPQISKPVYFDFYFGTVLFHLGHV